MEVLSDSHLHLRASGISDNKHPVSKRWIWDASNVLMLVLLEAHPLAYGLLAYRSKAKHGCVALNDYVLVIGSDK